jgi:hypothetical protein
MKYLLAFSIFIFSLEVSAQIRVESERDREGNVVLTAINSSMSQYTIQVEFPVLQNLRVMGGTSLVAVSNPGQTRIGTLKPINENQSTNYSYSFTYVKGSIYGKSKVDPIYLIPVAEGTEVLGMMMTHLENTIRPDAKNDMYVGVSFRFDNETEIVAPRKGIVVEMEMDREEGKENLAFDRGENYIEILHPDGTISKIMVLKGNSQKVELGEEVVPGQVLAISGGENYKNGRHVRMTVTKVEKDSKGKLTNTIIPVDYFTGAENKKISKAQKIVVSHPSEIVALELSKKELKALGLN